MYLSGGLADTRWTVKAVAVAPVGPDVMAPAVDPGGAPRLVVVGVVQGALAVNLVAELEGEHALAFGGDAVQGSLGERPRAPVDFGCTAFYAKAASAINMTPVSVNFQGTPEKGCSGENDSVKKLV
jgi:hypothetical protein